jgi:hypothetical protein
MLVYKSAVGRVGSDVKQDVEATLITAVRKRHVSYHEVCLCIDGVCWTGSVMDSARTRCGEEDYVCKAQSTESGLMWTCRMCERLQQSRANLCTTVIVHILMRIVLCNLM